MAEGRGGDKEYCNVMEGVRKAGRELKKEQEKDEGARNRKISYKEMTGEGRRRRKVGGRY